MKWGPMFILPALALALIVLADTYLVRQTTITPLGCTVLMAILALWLRPLPLSAWAIINFFAVFFMLRNGASNPEARILTSSAMAWTLVTRCTGFLLVSSVMIMLSIHRQQLKRAYSETLRILKNLPMPIIVSEGSGTIVFLNDRATDLLGLTNAKGIGLSYFSLLLHQDGTGTNFKKYVELIEKRGSNTSQIKIRTRNNPTKLLKGILVGIDTNRGRQLITVVADNPAISPIIYAMAARMAAKNSRHALAYGELEA